MAQTIQPKPVSPVLVETAKIQYTVSSSSSVHTEEDNSILMASLSLYDELSNLYDKLSALDYLLERKLFEIKNQTTTKGER